LVAWWDLHHLLTYGAGNPILANVIVQEHLQEEEKEAESQAGFSLLAWSL
jgi:hypothetical protein